MTKPTYPCSHMQHYAEFTCETYANLHDCPVALILYDPRFDEYGLPIKGGQRSILPH